MRNLLLSVLVLSGTASAAESFSIRAVPTIIWNDEAAGRVPAALRDRMDVRTVDNLKLGAKAVWPEAWEAGKARETGDLQRELGNMVHVGMRVSRVQENLVRFGSDKTQASVHLTATAFISNLSTGDVLASRTLTCVQPRDLLGVVTEFPREFAEELILGASTMCATALVEELSEHFDPTRTLTQVVGKHDGRFVVDRGYMSGGYKGEVFNGESGSRLRLVDVQAELSIATFVGKPPKDGETLSRFGPQVSAGSAPRLMAVPGDPQIQALPRVTEAEVAHWAADALSEQGGFSVIPHTDAMFLAADMESAQINVTRDALVGSQAAPDVAVLPQILDWSVVNYEVPGTDLIEHEINMAGSLHFVDVETGLVLYGTLCHDKATLQSDPNGKQADVEAQMPAMTRRTLRACAEKAKVEYAPERRYATVANAAGADKQFGWSSEAGRMGAGTVVEILDRGPEFTAQDGRKLGAVDEVIGTARVIASDDSSETAALIISTRPVGKNMRVRAVPGTTTSDPRIVSLALVEWKGIERRANNVAAAFHASSQFRTMLAGKRLEALDRAFSHLRGGSFGQSTKVEHVQATHTLEMSFNIARGDVAREVTNARKALAAISRPLEARAVLSVLDQEGNRLVLTHPRTGQTFDTYTWSHTRTLEGQEVKGVMPRGIQDNELDPAIGLYLQDLAGELTRRARLTMDSAE